MNIARLISPIILHHRPIHQRKAALDLYQTQQTHTPIAIPNQLPLCQRSYFKQSQFLKTQGESKSIEFSLSKQKPKLKKIDSDLCEIDKLKNQYAKRLKTQSYSQEKLGNRSNERHLLKPSAAPKIGISTSQFSIAALNERQNKNIKQETFSFQIQAKSPQTELFEDFQNSNYQKQIDSSKDILLRNISNKEKKCGCQSQFSSFMEKMKEKMSDITDRVKIIEQNNSKFKAKAKKPAENHKAYKKCSLQKQNVRKQQRILTQISNQANWDRSKQEQNSKVLKPFTNIDNSNQSKKSKTLNEGSKAKVEALLQRLHLRIQKQ